MIGMVCFRAPPQTTICLGGAPPGAFRGTLGAQFVPVVANTLAFVTIKRTSRNDDNLGGFGGETYLNYGRQRSNSGRFKVCV